MCGIVAYVGAGATPQAEHTVRRVASLLSHRGPDDAGVLVWSARADASWVEDAEGRRVPLPPRAEGAAPLTVVLASRRLAILDTSPTGHQPMVDVERRCAITYNGEIYNYVELRSELEGLGAHFRSQTDTEVLLAAYLAWGPKCLERLVGMFAFVLVDFRSGQVLVARDRFGMKPLFRARADGGWIFASEPGALLDGAGVARSADAQRVVDYLATGLTGKGTRTMLASVEQQPSASYALWSAPLGAPPEPVSYWRPAVDQARDVSFVEATVLVRDALVRSVELHLRSDVPVGVMLSGGTDSSAVACLMREVAGPTADIHTFSYIGEQGATSEEAWIDHVNRAIRATPHKLRLTATEWSASDPHYFHQGEPSPSLAVYAQGRLYHMAAAAGVRVALSGQGGDEMFGGYAAYWRARLHGLLARGAPLEALRFVRGIRHGRAATEPSALRVVAQAALLAAPPTLERRARARRLRTWVDREYRTKHSVESSPELGRAGRFAFRHALLRDQRVGLPSLLRYEDRNAMEHSVEGRLPFVSAPLVELTLSLPDDHFIGPDGTTKWILREAMRGLVPDSVLDRRDRVGFDVPVRSWTRLAPGFAPALHGVAALPPVDATAVARLEAAIARGPSPVEAFAAWRLVGLGAWARAMAVEWE